jgi:hypothetical protein
LLEDDPTGEKTDKKFEAQKKQGHALYFKAIEFLTIWNAPTFNLVHYALLSATLYNAISEGIGFLILFLKREAAMIINTKTPKITLQPNSSCKVDSRDVACSVSALISEKNGLPFEPIRARFLDIVPDRARV